MIVAASLCPNTYSMSCARSEVFAVTRNRANLCQGELQDDPFGYVRCPQHDALSRLDANRHEAAAIVRASRSSAAKV
jgi:hypothetical protein